MAAAIRRALAEEDGDVLAFLPGVGEIERTAERLEGISANLHRLHGSLDPAEQRAAIRKGKKRKVILATSIAETSLTIDGVRIVVDSGLARRARYDRAAGSTRLVTERASQAAVTQHAGRAARQGPGVAYRLWEEAATAGLPPLIRQRYWKQTCRRFCSIARCGGWAIQRCSTGLTRRPRLRSMKRRCGCTIWVQLMMKTVRPSMAAPSPGCHCHHGLPICWSRQRGWALPKLRRRPQCCCPNAGWVARMSISNDGWSAGVASAGSGPRRQGVWRNNGPNCFRLLNPPRKEGGLSGAIALAYPDRIARRRDASGEYWLSVGGRGYRLDPAHPLAKEEWLAVADIQGSAQGALILSAVAIDFATIEALYGDRIESGAHATFDPATGGVKTESGRRLGAITLSKGQDAKADPLAISAALLEGVRVHGTALLPWSDASQRLRERAAWAGVAGLSDADLADSLDQWLAPLLVGKRRLSDIDSGVLHNALLGLIGWDGQQKVERLAPPHLPRPPERPMPSITVRRLAPQSSCACRRCSAWPSIRLSAQTACRWCCRSRRQPPARSRPPATCPASGKAAGPTSPKTCAGVIQGITGPNDPAAAVASLKTKKKQGL